MKNLKWMFLDDDGIVTDLSPITSLADFHKAQWELGNVFFHANHALRPESDKIYYRGDCIGQSLGESKRVSPESLKRTFEDYKRRCPISGESDWETYIRMRHAGVRNTTLLDWTASPEIAIWFAIHDNSGNLKASNTGTLWAFRYTEEDVMFPENETEPIPSNGGSRSVIGLSYEEVAHCFYENDGMLGERPTKQKSAIVRLRLTVPDEKGVQYVLPMDKDPLFQGRLIRIEIEGDYELIDAELNIWLEHEIMERSLFSRYLALDNRRNERDYKVVQELNDTYEKELIK